MIIAIIAAEKWKCNSIDIKSAFLQGRPVDREILLKPPKEAIEEGLWKLKTCIYGLIDASRCWYLRVKEELITLNVSVSKTDPAVFFWKYDQVLCGVMTTHVDDFCWGGNKLFIENVIKPLRDIFSIGVEHSSMFRYLGLNVTQDEGSVIQIDQISYIQEIPPVNVSRERQDKSLPLTTDELRDFRGLIGRLSWVTGQTRPDLAFEVCELAASVKNATIEDLKRANKILKKAKSENVILRFGTSMKDISLEVYNDASFGNL